MQLLLFDPYGPLISTVPKAHMLQLVATNMIAEGRVWEGAQLLCLIDKGGGIQIVILILMLRISLTQASSP